MTIRTVSITRTLDTDGREIALVPLANHSQPVKLLADDFDALTQAGFTSYWTFNPTGNGYAYVRAARIAADGSLAIVARIIAGAGRGKRVQYRDGDRLNLRRDNLYLSDTKHAKHAPVLTLSEASRATSSATSEPTEEPRRAQPQALPPVPLKPAARGPLKLVKSIKPEHLRTRNAA